MGSVNNGRVGKPGGAKALAREYRRCQPGGAGVWGIVRIDPEKLIAAKLGKVEPELGAASRAGRGQGGLGG